jgi:hypothetical protein
MVAKYKMPLINSLLGNRACSPCLVSTLNFAGLT